MHPALIRPILRALDQSVPHRILTGVLPFLRVRFVVPQTMMKLAGLKSSRAWMRLRESILPKTHPPFDREFEIVGRAKQMEIRASERNHDSRAVFSQML